ncbi:ATP-binding protein [Niabella terrae]
MIAKQLIEGAIAAQKNNLKRKEKGLKRSALGDIPDLSAYALIVSGVRRCGKSTLLFQLLEKRYKDALYLNFEDTRLYGFELKDFMKLDEIILDNGTGVLLFDEIQIIPGWERYIRQKLDEDYKIVITGSNASLLSRELGTKLTGRQISKELFPFSYAEFSSINKLKASPQSVTDYLYTGGFPEYVKQHADDILHHIFEDILLRDIAVRHGIRDVKSLQRLALYLLSNTGKLVTANRLKSLMDIGSTSTVTEYLAYMEDSYLLYLVPRFDYSPRKQLVNPRKVYAIDTGLAKANSTSFSGDEGRLFENMVFLHLRRRYKQLYYFSGKGECDFLAVEKGAVVKAVQVCYDLHTDNLDRELNGLKEALQFFKLKEGVLVTLSREDHFELGQIKIKVVPAHVFLLE